MQQFQFHLREKLLDFTVRLEKLEKEIAKIPQEEDIILENYGTKKDLKATYYTLYPTSPLKKLIKPSKKDLQKLVRDNILAKLNEEKKSLTSSIEQIKEALESIKEDKLTDNLSNSNKLIIELLEYSLNSNLTAKRTIDIFLSIIRKTKKDDSLTNTIKRNILSFYNEDNTIIEGLNRKALILLYDKLFKQILSEEEQLKYAIVISNIKVEIELTEEQTKKETKESLLLQRESLSILQTYIHNEIILKPAQNIEEFKQLLRNAGLDDETRTFLLQKMEAKIEEENFLERKKQTINAVKNHLSETDLLHLKKAVELERIHTGQMKRLISRVKADVISICKYMELLNTEQDVNTNQEILTKRCAILKELVTSLDTMNPTLSSFYYLADDELIPYMLRSIEESEIEEQSNIYNLLTLISENRESKKLICTIAGISIYRVKNTTHNILFTYKGNKPIIIDVYKNVLNSNSKPKLNKKQIMKLRKILDSRYSKEYEELNTAYENLILSSLSLDSSKVQFSLSKRKIN